MILGAMAFINAGDDPLVTADELYAKRSNSDNVHQAVNLLKQAAALTPDNADVFWRLAKYHWYLGDQSTVKKTRLDWFAKGKEYAEQAVKVDPKNINAHFWLAAIIGAAGDTQGVLKSLASVPPMKKEIDICLQLDPKFPDAHDLLAQLYWLAPGPPLSIGNKKRALEESRLAVTYNPNDINFWLNLGLIARDNKDYAKAREAFQKILNMPDDPEEPAKSRKSKETATAELKKLEDKK
jgi:tetratricopeptide (TPR) repeat protein